MLNWGGDERRVPQRPDPRVGKGPPTDYLDSRFLDGTNAYSRKRDALLPAIWGLLRCKRDAGSGKRSMDDNLGG